MIVRPAAKVILTTGPGEILLVSGSSRRQNLPGGGIDAGEAPVSALLRELSEELAIGHTMLSDLRRACDIKGTVTNRAGQVLVASWVVFTAGLLVPIESLRAGDDIQGLQTMTTEAAFTDPSVSDLAKQALQIIQ